MSTGPIERLTPPPASAGAERLRELLAREIERRRELATPEPEAAPEGGPLKGRIIDIRA